MLMFRGRFADDAGHYPSAKYDYRPWRDRERSPRERRRDDRYERSGKHDRY